MKLCKLELSNLYTLKTDLYKNTITSKYKKSSILIHFKEECSNHAKRSLFTSSIILFSYISSQYQLQASEQAKQILHLFQKLVKCSFAQSARVSVIVLPKGRLGYHKNYTQIIEEGKIQLSDSGGCYPFPSANPTRLGQLLKHFGQNITSRHVSLSQDWMEKDETRVISLAIPIGMILLSFKLDEKTQVWYRSQCTQYFSGL